MERVVWGRPRRFERGQKEGFGIVGPRKRTGRGGEGQWAMRKEQKRGWEFTLYHYYKDPLGSVVAGWLFLARVNEDFALVRGRSGETHSLSGLV